MKEQELIEDIKEHFWKLRGILYENLREIETKIKKLEKIRGVKDESK